MNKIIQSIFKNKTANESKLLQYGFKKSAGIMQYQVLMTDSFLLKVFIQGDEVSSQVIELETGEPYTLFLVDGAQGSFVGEIREKYQAIMQDIAQKCFYKRVFKSATAKNVIEYISQKYGDKLEFLWEKFEDGAICRRQDNKKWYVVFMLARASKLGLQGDEKVEILNLKPLEPEKVVDFKCILPGYHMNKKYWVSILLEKCENMHQIFDLIDQSYALAANKQKCLVSNA